MRRTATILSALLFALPAWGQGSSGTGFAIAPGLVVTNHHVIRDCTSLAVVIPGQGRRAARLIAEDPAADLALIYALGLPGSIAPLRTTPARLGEPVFAFGFPLAGALSSAGNFTSGLVSALRGLGDKGGELQFSAPVQPGNSGGPLLDRSGLVIGVVQSKLDTIRAARVTGDIAQNVNFAVSGDVLLNFLEKSQANVQRQQPSVALDTTAVAEKAQAFSFQISCEGRSGSAAQTQQPPQPPTPNPAADGERALGLSPEGIRNVQLWLSALGHNPGPADGIIGATTRRAVQAYQRSKSIAETGFLSAELLSILRREGEAASTRSAPSSSPMTARRTFTYPDGSRYEGEHRDGKPHGRGIYTWASGARYEGDFQNDKLHGRGIYTSPNGIRYEGEFRDDRRNGRGIFAWANGDRYEGEFKDDKAHGRGIFTWANGDRYEGELRDGRRHGRGINTSSNGSRYEGEYQDGKAHGYGVFFDSQTGHTVQGLWSLGCLRLSDGSFARVGVLSSECR
jgi:S1-C subfamily serine protease